MNIEQARANMIEQQIRPWDVLDQRVLTALLSLPREEFVPESYRHLAFADVCLPYGNIRQKPAEQMLEPKLEGRLVQSLRLQPDHHVLLVGAGTGFVAALMAKLAKSVLAYEIDPLIADRARSNILKAGIDNVTIKTGDGLHPDTHVSFERILLAGSIAQVPKSLFHSLSVYGELVAIIGKPPVMQATRFNAKGDKLEELFDTAAPALTSAQVATFVF